MCAAKSGEFYRSDHSRDLCVHLRLGQLPARCGRNAVLAHTESKRRAAPQYPGGAEAQKAKLEAEGHVIVAKGRKNIRFFVKDYEKTRFELR